MRSGLASSAIGSAAAAQVCWPREDEVDHAEIAVLAGALGDLGGLGRHLVEREVAVDQLHLAGVDPLLLDLGQDLRVEVGAVRAGERGVFDQRDRRLGVAQHVVARLDGQEGGLVGGRRRPRPSAPDRPQADGCRNRRQAAIAATATTPPATIKIFRIPSSSPLHLGNYACGESNVYRPTWRKIAAIASAVPGLA